MGSLDEAKRQVYQKQVAARAAEQRADQLDNIYRERILPRMAYIHDSLGKLCERLNQSDATVKASYFIEGFGRLENLVQAEYRVSVDSLIEINEISFEFDCAGQGEMGVYVEGKKNVDMYLELFRENGLKFTGKVVKDDTHYVTGARLSVQRRVPVRFLFRVDIANAAIELRIRNFESLGENSLQFSAESITDEFMKKLAEYIVRKNKGFFSLDLSEIERRRIRARVLYEQQQRAAELEAADKHHPARDNRKKGFFTRLMGR